METKSVIFARVSTREQEETGYSLDAQIRLLEEYSQRKNIAVIKEFKVWETASLSSQRAKFKEMLAYMEKHDIQVLLCEKVDRLTRNLQDAVDADTWLDANPERRIHFVKQNLVLHKGAKSDEKFRWDMEVVLAKKYAANLSEEVRKGLNEKAFGGWFPGKPPIGYNTRGERGKKTHVLNAVTAPLMAEAFALYATGNYSLKRLLHKMTEKGLRNNGYKIARSRLHQLLRNPFYCGKFVWNGKLYDGKHEAIISQELFDLVQLRIRRQNTNPRHAKHLYPFKGKIFCAYCGGTITWYKVKGKIYGQCNHNKPCPSSGTVRQDRIETELRPYFDAVGNLDPRVLDWAGRAIQSLHTEDEKKVDAVKGSILGSISRLNLRLDRMYDDRLDGKIDEERYQRKLAQFEGEKEGLTAALSNAADSYAPYYRAAYKAHELAQKAWDIYASPFASVEERRDLLSCIFSNMQLKDRNIKVEFTLGFQFMAMNNNNLRGSLEPDNSGGIERQSGDFSPPCPELLRSQDSNLEPCR
jgi:DNA invertase Pin-like site-specific DNA recombinase